MPLRPAGVVPPEPHCIGAHPMLPTVPIVFAAPACVTFEPSCTPFLKMRLTPALYVHATRIQPSPMTLSPVLMSSPYRPTARLFMKLLVNIHRDCRVAFVPTVMMLSYVD